MVVPGYIINAKHAGMPQQVRSFFSAPNIEFGYHSSRTDIVKRAEGETEDNLEKFMLSDVESLEEVRGIQKRGRSSEEVQTQIINPFTGEKSVGFSKVLSRNERSGETVASNIIVKKLETQYE